MKHFILAISLLLIVSQPVSAQSPTYTASPSATTPTATPAPVTGLTCESLEILEKIGGYTPATFRFRTTVSNPDQVAEYRYDYGNGISETGDAETSYRYMTAGTYAARVTLIDQQGREVTSSDCQVEVQLEAVPLLAHRSSCDSLSVPGSQKSQSAPAAVTFTLTGSDNKGGLQGFRVEYGDGTDDEQATGSATFTHTYTEAGTYKAIGYVQDSQGAWKTNNPSCQQTITVTSTKVMEVQPETGPNPFLWQVAMLALSIGLLTRRLALSLKHK